MRLTDIQIKRIKPGTKPYKVSDGGGLFLWVTPAGGKIWRWAYRHEGRAKLMTFGKYPDVPLSLARERHAEARKLLATGIDPMAERKAEKGGDGEFLPKRCPPLVGALAGWEKSPPCGLCEAPHGRRYSSLPGRASHR